MTRNDAPRRQEIEELLPWYATGKLPPADASRVEAALENDAELAHELARARAELGETTLLNESLGAPSSRALETLFEKIDAEAAGPGRRAAARVAARRGLATWIAAQLSALQPRVLGWATAAAVLALVLQAGLLTALLSGGVGQGEYGTASAPGGPAVQGTFLLVGFQPGATAADITALLEANGATLVDGPRAGGFYRVRIADRVLPKEELDRVTATLRGQAAVVRFAAPAGG